MERWDLAEGQEDRESGPERVWTREGLNACSQLLFWVWDFSTVDELVKECKKTSEADFGYQTVFKTWRGVCGNVLQGKTVLQNSLPGWISPSGL